MDDSSSSLLDVVSRALSEAQQQNADLRMRLDEQSGPTPAEYAALKQAYDREKASAAKLRDAVKIQNAEAQQRMGMMDAERRAMADNLASVKQRAEAMLRDTATRAQDAAIQRDLLIQAQNDLHLVLDSSQNEALAAKCALSDLIQEHESLKRVRSSLDQKLRLQIKTLNADLDAAKEAASLKDIEMATLKKSVKDAGVSVKELRKNLTTVNEQLDAKKHEAETYLTTIFELQQRLMASERKPLSWDRGVKPARSFTYEGDTLVEVQPPAPKSPPPPRPPLDERQMYLDAMQMLPAPRHRLPFADNEPVGGKDLDVVLSREAWKHPRRYIYLPKRTVWCSSDRVHALVFSPVKEVNQRVASSAPRWVPHNMFYDWCDQEFELFMVGDDTEEDRFYYAGIYRVLSMRNVCEPGSIIPDDISVCAITRAMKFHTQPATRHQLKLTDLYPDGKPRTECFGLQCVGFDWDLYEDLRRKFKAAPPLPRALPAPAPHAKPKSKYKGKAKAGTTIKKRLHGSTSLPLSPGARARKASLGSGPLGKTDRTVLASPMRGGGGRVRGR
ncbi:hypothetical protein MKEN_00956400 [Mycena kentingensis (nom. inval.)]|nr:hypothetical protein MKEN_00956400 [Mycena kentingensis (nom. inval.)]